MIAAEVMGRFESLGENCEFGIAQRQAGIDPFGLFRFAATPLETALVLLRTGFEGVGEPANTDLWLRGEEWMVRVKDRDWSNHTWTSCKAVEHDAMLGRETKRLAFLRSRMLDLLGEGSRIFVVKRNAGAITEAQGLELLNALRTYGPNRLLVVNPGEGPEVHYGGLSIALMPRFAGLGNVVKETDGGAWGALCRRVLGGIDGSLQAG